MFPRLCGGDVFLDANTTSDVVFRAFLLVSRCCDAAGVVAVLEEDFLLEEVEGPFVDDEVLFVRGRDRRCVVLEETESKEEVRPVVVMGPLERRCLLLTVSLDWRSTIPFTSFLFSFMVPLPFSDGGVLRMEGPPSIHPIPRRSLEVAARSTRPTPSSLAAMGSC